jgi:phosphoribosyl-ATP pyrophosphohydrolase
MVIPSIDLMGGSTVQLVGGREKKLDAGDPRPIAQTFGLAGDVAVIDLDAAIGTGTNAPLIQELLPLARCRVGGGIRDVETARRWLDAGAAKIILGTAAKLDLLKQLPRERVIAALDADQGEIVVKGWRERTGERVADRMKELREHVSGFLVTFVEREGRMVGMPMDLVKELIEVATPARLTVAGGVATAEEIGELDRLGADAQVGMGLYTGRFDLAGAIAAPLSSDRPDGLWPTVVCDERGVALGLAYSNIASLREAVKRRQGVYWSRSRHGLWVKGESSGATQELLAIDLDCDRDCLRFTVRQKGAGFCHLNRWTCFGESKGLGHLEQTTQARLASAPPGSYTRRLLDDPALLRAKLIEEAGELADATERGHAAQEAADVAYFASVAMARTGATWGDVDRALDARALKLSRRAGDAKPGALGAASGGQS